MKKSESLGSKLFKDVVLDERSLSNVKGGGITPTEHKSGQKDTSNSSDGDKCWSLGNSDTAEDCSVIGSAEVGGIAVGNGNTAGSASGTVI